MIYVSIDVETTGLDRDNDQVIEIGAIIENPLDQKDFDDVKKFHAIVRHDRYSGGAYAINLNQRIFKILADREQYRDDALLAYDTKYNIIPARLVVSEFYAWLFANLTNKPSTYGEPIKLVAAGKNFASFDAPFLRNLPDFSKFIKFDHRHIDPAILYTNFFTDTSISNLKTCLEKAGLEPIVTHDAVKDAWDVIRLLRPMYDKLDSVNYPPTA